MNTINSKLDNDVLDVTEIFFTDPLHFILLPITKFVSNIKTDYNDPEYVVFMKFVDERTHLPLLDVFVDELN